MRFREPAREILIQRTRRPFPLAERIGPGGEGRSVGRIGWKFAGEELRRRDGLLIRRWESFSLIFAIVGGRGNDHGVGGSDESVC
jgi:hypothetical protein